jgi:hypothetical protein
MNPKLNRMWDCYMVGLLAPKAGQGRSGRVTLADPAAWGFMDGRGYGRHAVLD